MNTGCMSEFSDFIDPDLTSCGDLTIFKAGSSYEMIGVAGLFY